MKLPKLVVGLVLAPLLSLPPGSARACSLCACGDPLLAASDPAAIAGRLRLQLDAEYVRVDAGTEGRLGYTDQLAQWSYRLNAVYRPLERLSFLATFPFVSRSIDTVGEGTRTMMSHTQGLGDVEVAGRWAAWRSVDLGLGRVHEVAITAGTSLPTGATDARMSGGMPVDPHGQLGTGAWGPFAGLSYRYEQGSWLAFAALSARVRTEGSYADGARYRFGSAALWSVHGQYFASRRVALDLGVDGRYAAADRATDPDGLVDPAVANTGGTVLAVSPGVFVHAGGGAWLFARAQVPFAKRLRGEQDVLPSFTSGVQFLAF